ncbi:hypothetical protein MUP77_15945 [Candidatus Bathyarchaeota archaeon]|nr:hypothetical protein [Candidatus Bathyarchaeota archaeon]
MTKMSNSQRRILLPLLILFLIAGGMLALSTYYLFRAFTSYQEGATETSIYYGIIGATGIAITFYMTLILRKRSTSKKEIPNIMTTTECGKCGFKSLRKFAKGDYVFKTLQNCEKCNEPMIITSIYAEVNNPKKM